MNIHSQLKQENNYLSVIGLGYVGLPIAIAFSNVYKVIGYDISADKISLLKRGIDPTNEIGNSKVRESKINFTSNPVDIQASLFHIVTVPTPINQDRTPDLEPLISASKILGKNIKKGSYVVYESTVYPGATEDLCIPIIEKYSGLKSGLDFIVGYSPERVNPGDKKNTLENIIKIVSSQKPMHTKQIAQVYKKIIKAGIHEVSSIKVAEATKVAENSQRDMNIAFMNELSMTFKKMNIDSHEVVNAMNTKWNALKFLPGLVGGHCIGVDPYYLIYQAKKSGYDSQLISLGRKINDDVPKFIVQEATKLLIINDFNVKKSKIAIFGLTFKENINDTRNSKVFDLIQILNELGNIPYIVEPNIDSFVHFKNVEYKIVNLNELNDINLIIVAVGHKEFTNLNINDYKNFYNSGNFGIIMDIKSIYSKELFEKNGIIYWNL